MQTNAETPPEVNAEESREIVRRLLGVISRAAPMEDARALLDENLIAYMDDKQISRGCDAWFRWVRFLHYNADKKMSGLTLDVERMEVADGVVSVFAKWGGTVGGVLQQSETGAVKYTIRDGKIAAIQTHKKNYIFIYGRGVATTAGFLFVLLRLFMWKPR